MKDLIQEGREIYSKFKKLVIESDATESKVVESRKITDKIVAAFIAGTRVKSGNDFTDGTILQLHGNTIAKKENGSLWITNAGWATNTTKERLNGIPGVSIQQKAGTWYLNGKPWNGDWIEIGPLNQLQ